MDTPFFLFFFFNTGSKIMTGVLGITVISGAFVAGNDAGRAYNDWPLMAGQWIPNEIWMVSCFLKIFC